VRPRLVLVLCAYLAVWIPLNAAALASSSLPSLAVRGPAAALELAVHVASAAVCFAAGWMLWNRSAAGIRFAALALCVNVVAAVQPLHVSALPRDVPPGLAWPLTVLTLVFTTAWLVYLRRSRRLHAWLE
jgi:hypothetical protein